MAKKRKLTEDNMAACRDTTGSQLSDSCQAVVVSISDDACDLAKEKNDPDLLEMMTLVQGTYWLIGSLAGGNNDYPVFRQEPGDAPCNLEVFLFHCDDKQVEDWYIARDLFLKQKDMDALLAENQIYGWIKDAGYSPIGISGVGTIHCPFWSKKQFKGFQIQSLVDVQSARIQELDHIATVVDVQAARIQELEAELEAVASDAGKAGKDKGQGGGKGGKPKGQHGGWLPKCAKLVKAYLAGNWDSCNEMCAEYMANDIVAQLVQSYQ